jgi:hypothetical protein
LPSSLSSSLVSWQPSQVGIALSNIGFQTYFGNTNIGPVTSNGSFTLAPLATSLFGLVGRLVPQTQKSGLLDVSTIFNNFIHGLDSNISVHVDNAGPGDVRGSGGARNSDTNRNIY